MSKKNGKLKSSKKWLVELVKAMFNADVEFIPPNNDGLSKVWNSKNIFVKPPYGREEESNWLSKCAFSNGLYDLEILALVPVATNSSHWKDYVFGEASAICFFNDTRLKIPCAMIYYGENITKFRFIFSEYGAVVNISDRLSFVDI